MDLDELIADDDEADALAVRERGFRGCKVKVGRPHVSEDIARLEAVRDAMGPGFEIFTASPKGLNQPPY